MTNFFISFSCRMNGVDSYGNTVLSIQGSIQSIVDIMAAEKEIKELFEKDHPGVQLDNACILNIVKL